MAYPNILHDVLSFEVNKLDASGGIIKNTLKSDSGHVIYSTKDTSEISFFGGSSYATGAGLMLYGSSHTSTPGYFKLSARNSSNTYELSCNPANGRLTYNGNLELLKPLIYTNSGIKAVEEGREASEYHRHATFYDGSGKEFGAIESAAYNNNTVLLKLQYKHTATDGTASYEHISVGYNYGTGRFYTHAPNPPADSDQPEIATTAWVKDRGVCTTYYKSGTTWYRKYSDGYMECGGRYTGTTVTSATITFPITFSNTNYTLTCQDMEASSTDTDGVDMNIMISNLTTTSFRVTKAKTRQVLWHVCGY